MKYESASSFYRDKSLHHHFLQLVYETCFTADVKGISYEDWEAMKVQEEQQIGATTTTDNHHLIPIKNIQQEEQNLKVIDDDDIGRKVYDVNDIPLNIYLHCAMPNMHNYNNMLQDLMKTNGKTMLESQKIYQLHQYERASQRETEICHVTGFLIENSIDLHLNPYDYSKDLYLPSFYKKNIKLKKSLYRQQLYSTNYVIIDLNNEEVLKTDPVFKRVREFIDVFFHRRNNNAFMISSLWKVIKRECNVSSFEQFKRYVLYLRSKNILYSKMGYIKLDLNAEKFDYHDSILHKKPIHTNEYNIETIKSVLNVPNKIKLLNQYLNIPIDNNEDLGIIGEYLHQRQQQHNHDDLRRGQKRSFLESNSENATILNIIESLPSDKRHKILEKTSSATLLSSTVASRLDQKQSIIESLVKHPRYVELNESLKKIMIGIKTKNKFYVYILNHIDDFQSNEKSMKSEIHHFLQSFVKKHKHTCHEYISSLEPYLQRRSDEVVENWKTNIYPVILSILEHLESSVVDTNATESFIRLPFNEKINYASNLFEEIIVKDSLIDDRNTNYFIV